MLVTISPEVLFHIIGAHYARALNLYGIKITKNRFAPYDASGNNLKKKIGFDVNLLNALRMSTKFTARKCHICASSELQWSKRNEETLAFVKVMQ